MRYRRTSKVSTKRLLALLRDRVGRQPAAKALPGLSCGGTLSFFRLLNDACRAAKIKF